MRLDVGRGRTAKGQEGIFWDRGEICSITSLGERLHDDMHFPKLAEGVHVKEGNFIALNYTLIKLILKKL